MWIVILVPLIVILLLGLHKIGAAREEARFAGLLAGFPASFSVLGSDYKSGLAVDLKGRTVCLVGSEARTFRFCDILAVELAEPGRLTTFPWVQWDVQAVELRILVNDITSPNFVVNFYGTSDHLTDGLSGARARANLWLGRLRAVVADRMPESVKQAADQWAQEGL